MSNISIKPISLADWQLIKISGVDNHKYLQGQITINTNNLTEHSALFAAHCNSQGKMWSNLLLFQRDQDIYYIVRKSVAKKQMTALQKYAVFSKVSIEPVTDLHIVGLDSEAIPSEILSKFNDNNCFTENNITYIKLTMPHVRIIMVTPETIDNDLEPCGRWLQLDLEAGYAIIDIENIESLLPQACNLQYHNAISFDKGCYCGQEMIARAQYRGANKHGLYLLSGKSAVLPVIGETIEYQINGNWRESGQVLATLKLNQKNDVYVQVVLANGLELNTQFRVKGETDSKLNFY